MSEPEILKLLMMHMSKNHHEDELETFGDPEFKKKSTEEHMSEDIHSVNSPSSTITLSNSRKQSNILQNKKA